jgi:hypothetical protein
MITKLKAELDRIKKEIEELEKEMKHFEERQSGIQYEIRFGKWKILIKELQTLKKVSLMWADDGIDFLNMFDPMNGFKEIKDKIKELQEIKSLMEKQ